MKLNRIDYYTNWDIHDNHSFIYLNKGKVIASFQIEYSTTKEYDPVLCSVYVQPEYRGKGISKIIMDDAMEVLKDQPIINLKVRKDNFIKNTYEKYGFQDNYEEGIYFWMFREIK